ncbi:MAG: hypothetical protein K6G90_12770 [Clostridia bacterium]|nr:hypothetical protein [Clostridia bacterium]
MHNKNDRVRIKGTVSRATAEAIRRGEIESNNGLRKSSGRRSWNPEQPEFELDEDPTIYQQAIQFFKQALFNTLTSIVFDDLIPVARDIFHTEGVPFIKSKIHERTESMRNVSQKAEVKANDNLPVMEDQTFTTTQSNKVFNISEYQNAVNH